jgi:hypothetical protein
MAIESLNPPGYITRFLGELQRRRVCRTTMTYGVIVWLVLQASDVAFPLIGVPEWGLKAIVALGALGLPVTIALAWIYDITPHGIVADSEQPAKSTEDTGAASSLVNAGLLTLGIALACAATYQFVVRDPEIQLLALGTGPQSVLYAPAAGADPGGAGDAGLCQRGPVSVAVR